MDGDVLYAANSVLLGLGLAADAFSVAVANGVAMPDAGLGALIRPAAVFGVFQAAAPMLGCWIVGAASPYAALLRTILTFAAPLAVAALGIKMLLSRRRGAAYDRTPAVGWRALLLQGTATSADAFCAGLADPGASPGKAALRAGVIGGVTALVCFAGGLIGRGTGGLFAGKSEAIGGGILIAVGAELFLQAVRG